MEQAPSTGKTVAVAAAVGTQAATLLLYIVHLMGINDMPPEVANAIIGLSVATAGWIMHKEQRKKEAKAYSQNIGGVDAGAKEESQQ